MKDLDHYQKTAFEFCLPQSQDMFYLTLGLVSEAGEVADKLKKVMRDGGELDGQAVAKELGDVMWYAANLSHILGYSLSEVARMNIGKLSSRRERDKIGGSGDDR